MRMSVRMSMSGNCNYHFVLLVHALYTEYVDFHSSDIQPDLGSEKKMRTIFPAWRSQLMTFQTTICYLAFLSTAPETRCHWMEPGC